VLRRLEDGVARAVLDDAALVHDRDDVADVAYHAEIVADEEVADAELALQVHEQVEDLALDGDVERRDGLVADDEVGLERERTGDSDALLLATRERGRPSVAQRRIDADSGQQRVCPAAPLGGIMQAVDGPGLGDDVVRTEARVKGSSRVLIDELDVATHASQLFAAQGEEIHAAEHGRPGVRIDETEQQPRGRRLARTGAAHQAVRLAWLDGEIDVVDGAHDPASRPSAGGERLAQAAGIEQEVGHARSVAVSATRSTWARPTPLPHRRIAALRRPSGVPTRHGALVTLGTAA